MTNFWWQAPAFLVGVLCGGMLIAIALRSRLRLLRQRNELDALEMRRQAEAEGSEARDEKERALRQRENAVADGEDALRRAEKKEKETAARLDGAQKSNEEREKELEGQLKEARKKERLYRMRLHAMQDWDEERARHAALEEARKDCLGEIERMRRELLGKSESQVEDEAKKILLAAMQRLAFNPAIEISAALVKIKSEHMKGRIIGREGRNIRTFEALTGTTLMIDETPDTVLVSSFDPVRREVARLALEALTEDGRINPATIEETVQRCQDSVNRNLKDHGEQALRQLRLPAPDPEIVELLGKLHYRLSNNQNTLDHSIEVAFICAILADELKLNRALAMRAGLYHDLGKAVSHEFQGSHAAAAADLLKRHGEDPQVINAVAAHHDEVSDQSIYAPLLKLADSLSAMRPGARSDSMESYVKRIKSLEDLAKSLPGVMEAHAIQAGRELRVIVSPENLTDLQARDLAILLRQRIEEEFHFPGSIKITVIREQRFQETAK